MQHPTHHWKTRLFLQQFLVLLALVAGCAQNEGMRTANEMLDSIQAVSDLLKSVRDPASAQAAAPQLGPAFQKMLDSMDKMIAYEQQHGEVRGRKGPIEQLKKDLMRLQGEFAAESERVDAMPGLPADFWAPMREYGAKVVLAGLKATGTADPAATELIANMIALYDSVGVKNTVEFGVTNVFPENRAEIVEKFRKLCGENPQLVDFDDPDRPDAIIIMMGPVTDFDGLIAKIDFGKVVEQEKNRGEFEVELEPPQAEAGVSPSPESESPAARARAEAEEMMRIQQEETLARMRVEAAKHGIDPEEFDRVASGVHEPMEAESEELDESAPDYHAKLAKKLSDGNVFEQREATEKLLRIDPASVVEKEVRSEIARGFRDLAMDSPHPNGEAIEGLVIWGGKHSVPLLIELMEKQSRMKVDDAIYNGLAEHPTPEGAEAVAARVGNFFDGEMAASCLKKMGAVAEDAVIEVAPSNNLDVNLFALDFLADHGTKKCYPLLQRARKSPNPQIKEAAAKALREIRLRKQEEEDGEKKSAA